jgi:Leucine-rich repeat (LRR) protein
MVSKRTPSKILDELKKNILDKQSGIQQLIAIIENSTKLKNRLESLRGLRKLNIDLENFRGNNDALLNFFENLLISDTDEMVRNEAALILCKEYSDKALNPMRWALSHEDSPLCLHTILNALIRIVKNIVIRNEPAAKLMLIHEIKQMNEKDFIIGFEILKTNRSIKDFTSRELADILINYFTIVYLKKSYWRLRYTIESCKVVELDFIFKGLTQLPDALKNLTYLKKIILRYNQITELPDWIEAFQNLESLNLNVNNINKLPISIGKLNRLEELLLWKNELQHLPNSICSLQSLKYLNLRLNQIKQLPIDLGNLKNLIELNLHDNKLTEIPLSISSLKSLETLNLSWNLLNILPSSMFKLISLKSLNLERNEITEISESIGLLTSLEVLNLSDNKLETVPDTIGCLKNLKILNLSRNKITELPNSIYDLDNLEELYLSENFLNTESNLIKKLIQKEIKIYF